MSTGLPTTTMTVIIASTSVGLPGAPDQQDVLPPPSQISVHIMKGIADFTTLSQQQPVAQMDPQESMPLITQAYAKYDMVPP